MIAEQCDDATACVLRLPLKPHQQVEHRSRAGAAVHVVARLYEDGVAARPPAAIVDETSDL